MPLEYLISAAVTLFVVVDPIGLAPTFLSVTTGIPDAARRDVALRAAVIAGAILAGAALIGDWLLRQLGITLPAFRIAGGLLLFSIASEMVLGVRIERQSRDAEQACEEHVRNIAAFPLLAGPGALTATVLLAGQAAFRPLYVAVMVGVIAAIVALCLLALSTCSTVSNLRSWWRITPSSAKYRASLCFSRMSPADLYMSFGAFRRAAQNRLLW